MADQTLATNPQTIEAPAMTFQDLLRGVPPVVRGYVLSPEFTKRHNALFDREKIAESERGVFLELSLEVFCGLVKPEEYFNQAWERLAWTTDQQARLKKICADVLSEVMHPVRQYFGDLTPTISALGTTANTMATAEIPWRTIEYPEAFAEVFRVIDPENEIYDLAAHARIEAIMRQQMTGLTREEAMARYMRGEKVGGAGLGEEEAALITLLVAQTMLYTKFVEPAPEVDEVAEYYKDEEGAELAGELSTTSSEAKGALPPKQAPTYTEETIRAIYNGSAEERQRLNETVQKLIGLPNGHEKAVAIAFASPAVQREQYDLLAALLFLAQDGSLLEVAKKDSRYAASVAIRLSKSQTPAQLDDIIANPENPRYIAAFLAYQLENCGKFLTPDSARFSLRIMTMLKKKGWQGPDIAAFDQATGKFRFTQEV